MKNRAFSVVASVAAAVAAGIVVTSAQTGSGAPPAAKPSLSNPASLNEKAPATFKAAFDTSAGPFVVEVTREWAPLGADRFYNLVKNGFYNECRFFRVMNGFMAQFGINGTPAIQAVWRNARINDEPVKQSNKRGFITYAKSNTANTRTTQVFINFRDNSNLDADGFSPFGQVTSGMENVDTLNSEYGGGPPTGPDQGQIQSAGNAYLLKSFPKLDVIKTATIQK